MLLRWDIDQRRASAAAADADTDAAGCDLRAPTTPA